MNIHERKCHWLTRLVGMIFAMSYGETLVNVVCLSVTFVHPTQAIEIFGDVSTPLSLGTLAIF